MDLGIEGRIDGRDGRDTRDRRRGRASCWRRRAPVVARARSEGVDVTAPDAAGRIGTCAGGAVNILVNNAGTSEIKSLDELVDDDWYAAFELERHGADAAHAALRAGRWRSVAGVGSSTSPPARASGRRRRGRLTRSRRPRSTRSPASTPTSGRRSGMIVSAVAPGPAGTPLWRGPGRAGRAGGRAGGDQRRGGDRAAGEQGAARALRRGRRRSAP